jgi:hypothetical protein
LALSYTRHFFGVKKPRTDPVLKGRADFFLEVDSNLRVIVETKKPGSLTDDDREQAYTYAMHPQVRAVLFVVISGKEFEIWSRLMKPEAGPILAFKYEELDKVWPTVKNVLSPDAIRRDFPGYVIDVGAPLAARLRSFAKMEYGTMRYDEVPPALVSAQGLTIHFSEGFLERRDAGGILLRLRPSHPYDAMMTFQNAISDTLDLTTTAETISSHPDALTLFEGEIEKTIPAGTPIPDRVQLNRTAPSAADVRLRVKAVLHAYINGSKLHGSLVANDAAGQVTIRTSLELIFR